MPRGPGGGGGGVVAPPRWSLRNGYSLFVGTLKLVLPALTVALILLVVAWPQLAPEDKSFRVGISDLMPEQADNLSMVNPRFQGRDDRGRPFTVLADSALQATSGANLIRLEQPKADITLDSGAWISVSAQAGRYWRNTERLHLSGEVSLFHDRGFEMHTPAANVDLKGGTASSTSEVTGQGPDGLLNAEGFRVLDRGSRIIFTGRSRLTIFADESGSLQ